MENFINPEDLEMIVDYYKKNSSAFSSNDRMATEATSTTEAPEVGCFGAGGGFLMRALNKIFSFNLKPASSDDIVTQFYFSSRKMKFKVLVSLGKQFSMESVDFDPKRKTVLIVHGFMSYSGADWIVNMTREYLEWEDVNVIAVDWSGGSNTFKYWRAVANTRTVGRDIANFMSQVKNETGLDIKNCHFIGHSLGAQIVSFASNELGKVGRITGLDPALPCFNTTSLKDRLDPTDADFVDVIHTNGKLAVIGFGFPYPTGHIDFYPNGGIRQPGCLSSKIPLYNTLDQAICSHGRAYLLFTESFKNKNCKFLGSPWDLTVAGLGASVGASCEKKGLCSEMGIRTSRKAKGAFLVITKDKEPYCVTHAKESHTSPDLMENIINHLHSLTGTTAAANGASSISSIIPFREAKAVEVFASTMATLTPATSSWFSRFLKYFG